ncbi:hypothetical protein GCM10027262_12820 [Nocardia tengchongensis]
MPGEAPHRPLLAKELVTDLFHVTGEDLHRHIAVRGDLRTSVDDPETAPADLLRAFETGSAQFRDDVETGITLRFE